MAAFKDNLGRAWIVHLDAPTIKRVREDFDGLDLADRKGELARALIDPSDPLLPCDLLWYLCKKQAAEAGVSEEEFYTHVLGDAIEAGVDAVLEAVTDFTPPRKRELLRLARTKDANIRQTAFDAAIAKLNDPQVEEAVKAEVERSMQNEMEKMLTQLRSATTSPVSLASAQTDGP